MSKWMQITFWNDDDDDDDQGKKKRMNIESWKAIMTTFKIKQKKNFGRIFFFRAPVTFTMMTEQNESAYLSILFFFVNGNEIFDDDDDDELRRKKNRLFIYIHSFSVDLYFFSGNNFFFFVFLWLFLSLSHSMIGIQKIFFLDWSSSLSIVIHVVFVFCFFFLQIWSLMMYRFLIVYLSTFIYLISIFYQFKWNSSCLFVCFWRFFFFLKKNTIK